MVESINGNTNIGNAGDIPDQNLDIPSTENTDKAAAIDSMSDKLKASGIDMDKSTVETLYNKLKNEGYDPNNMSANDIMKTLENNGQKWLNNSMMDNSLNQLSKFMPSKPDMLAGATPDSTV